MRSFMSTTSPNSATRLPSGAPSPDGRRTFSPAALWQGLTQSFAVPVLAIFTALIISALIILVSTSDPSKIIGAYAGLWQGAAGSPKNIAGTLETSTPYIFAGLAVALAFKCGLFNIGAEGQLALGAVFAAFAGYNFTNLPFPLHMIVTLAA